MYRSGNQHGFAQGFRPAPLAQLGYLLEYLRRARLLRRDEQVLYLLFSQPLQLLQHQ